jgi:predicted dehydrogenase
MFSGKKLGIGVIGVGRVAQAHLAAVSALKEETDLLAVADVEEEKARGAMEKYRAGYFTTYYEDLLRDPGVEAVIITLPNHLHHSAALAAARAGKHILIEKPMAMNIRQAREMVAAAEYNRVTFMVGQSRRFSEAAFALREKLPEIGELFRVIISFLVSFPSPPTNWWRRSDEAGGLVILLQGSHSLDSILTWMGKMPQRVFTFSSRRNPQWEGEDEADILLSFDRGESASVHLSLSTSPAFHEALLVGTRGVIRLIEYPTGKPFGFGYHLELNGKRILSGDQVPSNYTLQLKEFVSALRERRTPIASGEEILKTQLLLDAARQSEQGKKPVYLSP